MSFEVKNTIEAASAITEPTKANELDRTALLARCRDLALKKSILHVLDDDLRRNGFAGSTNIPLLVYLASFTRMFDDPVSLVIKGQSGIGKSFALRSGLRYVPDAAVHQVHGLSAKALVHAAKTNLKNRFLVVQELAGFAKEGLVFLRQLLTEGKVTYMTVAQTRDGHEGKQLDAVEGPTGVMMTTTANSLHWEDETRMLSLYVDQSSEHIRSALMVHAEGPAPKPSDDCLSQWHAFHDYVCSGSLEVIIPFRKALISKLPTSHARVLRDMPKVLALIRAHALIHQETRKRSGEAVFATMDDYVSVYELVSTALAVGLKQSVPPHISESVNAAVHLHAQTGRSVSQIEIAKHLDRDPSTIGRHLAVAVREGFLFNETPGQGRSHAYAPGERELPSRSVLPTPDELWAATDFPAGS